MKTSEGRTQTARSRKLLTMTFLALVALICLVTGIAAQDMSAHHHTDATSN